MGEAINTKGLILSNSLIFFPFSQLKTYWHMNGANQVIDHPNEFHQVLLSFISFGFPPVMFYCFLAFIFSLNRSFYWKKLVLCDNIGCHKLGFYFVNQDSFHSSGLEVVQLW